MHGDPQGGMPVDQSPRQHQIGKENKTGTSAGSHFSFRVIVNKVNL